MTDKQTFTTAEQKVYDHVVERRKQDGEDYYTVPFDTKIPKSVLAVCLHNHYFSLNRADSKTVFQRTYVYPDNDPLVPRGVALDFKAATLDKILKLSKRKIAMFIELVATMDVCWVDSTILDPFEKIGNIKSSKIKTLEVHVTELERKVKILTDEVESFPESDHIMKVVKERFENGDYSDVSKVLSK